MTPYKIVKKNQALKMQAVFDFTDGEQERVAGDTWIKYGPLSYIPRPEEEILETIEAIALSSTQALMLRASSNLVERDGTSRRAGEQWVFSQNGFYLPSHPDVVVDGYAQRFSIGVNEAVHLEAKVDFVDAYKI